MGQTVFKTFKTVAVVTMLIAGALFFFNKLDYFTINCGFTNTSDKLDLSPFCREFIKSHINEGNEQALGILISDSLYKNDLINNISYFKLAVSKGVFFGIEQSLYLCTKNADVAKTISSEEFEKGFFLVTKKSDAAPISGHQHLESRWRAGEFKPCTSHN